MMTPLADAVHRQEPESMREHRCLQAYHSGDKNVRRVKVESHTRRRYWVSGLHRNWRRNGPSLRCRRRRKQLVENWGTSWPSTYRGPVARAGQSECFPYGREICSTVASAFLPSPLSRRMSACETTPTSSPRSSTIGIRRTCS